MAVITVDQNNFEQEVLKASEPVLVDFWATWCGPCRMISPVVEEIAESAQGFKVVKINVDENPQLSMQYRITSIPSLVVFKDGAEAKRSVGVIPKDQILELVK